jgi:hypothetical protein
VIHSSGASSGCHNSSDFGFLITRSLSAPADCWIPQRGMLARLAAHINAGQMAAVGLGAGGEAAIVIDDNCTVSMVLEHRQLHNCHSRLLTREPRLCELSLSSDDCTTHENDISNEREWTGSWQLLQSPMSKLSFLLGALWASFGLQTNPRLHYSYNISFALEYFLSNVGITLGLCPPQHEQCIRFLLPSSMYSRLSPLSHCTFVPPLQKQPAAT